MTFVPRRALLVCNGGKIGRGTIAVTYQPRLEKSCFLMALRLGLT
jgi:hypothetical protein